MKPKTKSSPLSSLAQTSLILTFLRALVGYLYDLAASSLIGSLLTSYRPDRDHTETTGIYHALNSRRFSFKNRLLLPAKRFINRLIKGSLLLSLLHTAMKRLFDFPVRFWGNILVTTGVTTFALDLFLRLGQGQAGLGQTTVLSGLLIAFSAFPLLFSTKPLCEALYASSLIRFLLCTVLGYPPASFKAKTAPSARSIVALLIGIALGMLSIRFSPLSLLVDLLIVITLYLIFCTPEIGVLLMFSALPFVPTTELAYLILLTLVAFSLKVMQGKRSLKFELIDFLVLGFAAFLLIGGFFSYSPQDSLRPALTMTCLMGGYFLTVSLVRSREMVARLVGISLAGCAIQVAYSITTWFFSVPPTALQDMTLFADIRGSVIGTFGSAGVLGAYLILLIPLFLVLRSLQTESANRVGVAILITLSVVTLGLTWSRSAWIGLAIGLLLFWIFGGRKSCAGIISALFVILAASPLIRLLLPDGVLSRLSSIFIISESSARQHLTIWETCADLARDVIGGGIGTGPQTFEHVFSLYTESTATQAPHAYSLYLQFLIEHGILGLLLFLIIIPVFLASCFTFLKTEQGKDARSMRLLTVGGMCGILAFLTQGLFDYAFADYRIFALFWMLLALVTSARRTTTWEQTAHSVDDDHLLLT